MKSRKDKHIDKRYIKANAKRTTVFNYVLNQRFSKCGSRPTGVGSEKSFGGSREVYV